MITDSTIAMAGRLVNDRAAAGGPIISEKISSAPTTGTVSGGGGEHEQERELHPVAGDAFGFGDVRDHGGVQERPVEHGDRGDAGEREQRDGEQLGSGDAECLAEQE